MSTNNRERVSDALNYIVRKAGKRQPFLGILFRSGDIGFDGAVSHCIVSILDCISHAPVDYRCPFCAVIAGEEGEFPYSKQADIVHLDAEVLVMISSHWWPGCEGNALIIPVRHVENIYDMTDDLMGTVAVWSRRVAIAMKESYGCDGVSLRQHNEPRGGQDVWHYHQHVFPRYPADNLYGRDDERFLSDPAERRVFAQRLRGQLD